MSAAQTTNAATHSAPLFRGWLRVKAGRVWREACRGASEGECWSAMLLVAGGPHVDKLVLPAGRDPNTEKRRP